MAAAVSGDRRESLGGRHSSAAFSIGMERDYRRQDKSRSPRYPTTITSSSTSSPPPRELLSSSSAKMEQPQQQRSPTTSTGHRRGLGDDRHMHEWRYPRHSDASLKRRNSQRSPSRPRSQQGSQIDTVKEADAERERAEGHVEEELDQRLSRDSLPRKAARLDHQHHRKNQSSGALSSSRGRDDGAANMDWSYKKTPARMSDSDPASASSSRLQVSHSRASSGEDGDVNTRQGGSGSRRGNEKTSAMGSLQELEEEQGSNYTWQAERDDQQRRGSLAGEADVKSDDSASSPNTRLPPLSSGFRSMAAPPVSSAASYNRNSSPSPRLPSFASLQPHSTSSHANHRHGGDEERGMSPPGPRHHPSSAYHIQRYPSPRLGSSAHSPSLSQTSQAQQLTPGQAFIHPALAGLPGAGGVAGSKQQPSFVSKLYSMLEDETIEDMIAWGPSGTVFSVANPAEFSKVVLPNWFKHSNWQSFVRQLNMYGFHKVNHTYQGTPEEEIQVWEFKHPSFRRGEIQLLNDIKRKSSRHKRQGSLNRSMTNVGDFDPMGGRSPGSGTPSPEIPLSHLGPPGTGRGGMLPQQQQHLHHHHRPHSRSIGASSGFPAYREFGHANAAPGMPGRHHGMAGPSGMVYATAPGEVVMREEMAAGGMVASEGVAVRMDDLSDRIDAIIRHASYLESQLRSVSDQLYQSQQNEVNLGRHVQHLEGQMRNMEELLQARQQVPIIGAPIPPKQQQQQQRLGSPPPPSHSSSIPSSSARESARQGGSNFPARSPVNTHPSYSSSFSRAAASHSSADAYQKLPPPPSPSMRRDEPHSPAGSVEKRYRN